MTSLTSGNVFHIRLCCQFFVPVEWTQYHMNYFKHFKSKLAIASTCIQHNCEPTTIHSSINSDALAYTQGLSNIYSKILLMIQKYTEGFEVHPFD
jgi:hypothetical protein